jgi:hypothetical protein
MILLIVAGAAIIWIQRNSIIRLERENQELVRLKVDKQELERLRAENREVQRLRAQNMDLQWLRGEIAALRSQGKKPEKPKSGGPQSSAEDTAGGVKSPLIWDDQSYFAKDSWTDAGFDTPMDTVETMFWAFREGDFEKLLECMSEADAERFAAQFQSDADVEKFWEETSEGPAGRIPGYNVASIRMLTGDQAVVTVVGQLPAPPGETATFHTEEYYLTRFDDGWRVDQAAKSSAGVR